MSEKEYIPQKPRLYDIKEHEFSEGKQNGRIQFIQISDNCTLQFCEIRQPHETGPHRHDYEQIIFVPRGECYFWCDGVSYELDEGCFMAIPPNAEHYLEAKGNMYVVDFDIFTPRRGDRIQSKRICDRGHKNWDKGIVDEITEVK
jgi:quercetin dioxygenase-like cupin family protein